MRELFTTHGDAYVIWMDTVINSKYTDTDKLWEPPDPYDIVVTTKETIKWAEIIYHQLVSGINIDHTKLNHDI